MEVTKDGVMYNGKLISHLEALVLIAESMEGVMELLESDDYDHSDMYYRLKYGFFKKIGWIEVKNGAKL